MYYISIMVGSSRKGIILLLVIISVVSISIGLTSFLWNQYSLAILFTIIIPLIMIYILISANYKKKPSNELEDEPSDNYFNPV